MGPSGFILLKNILENVGGNSGGGQWSLSVHFESVWRVFECQQSGCRCWVVLAAVLFEQRLHPERSCTSGYYFRES